MYERTLRYLFDVRYAGVYAYTAFNFYQPMRVGVAVRLATAICKCYLLYTILSTYVAVQHIVHFESYSYPLTAFRVIQCKSHYITFALWLKYTGIVYTDMAI